MPDEKKPRVRRPLTPSNDQVVDALLHLSTMKAVVAGIVERDRDAAAILRDKLTGALTGGEVRFSNVKFSGSEVG